MAQLRAESSKARTGLFASLLIHAALLAVVALSLPRRGPPPEPRAVEIGLVPPAPPLPPNRSRTPRHRPMVPAAPPATAASAARWPQTPRPAPPPALATSIPGPDEQVQARTTAVLRGSVGCEEAKLVRLSQAELDRCAKWRQAHVDPSLEIPAQIAPEKRAWFDAVVAARSAPDHGPGLVCFGKPPHGLKLGPLPCYIEPPKGPLTEDVDAPPAPEH